MPHAVRIRADVTVEPGVGTSMPHAVRVRADVTVEPGVGTLRLGSVSSGNYQVHSPGPGHAHDPNPYPKPNISLSLSQDALRTPS